MKTRGRQVMKRHYFVLAFLILILVLFGTEYSGMLSSWQLTPGSEDIFFLAVDNELQIDAAVSQ